MKQKSLAQAARTIRSIAAIALAVLIVAFAIARIGLDFGPNLLIERRFHDGGWLSGFVSDLSAVFFMVALVQLIRLLGRLSAGELFAPTVTGAFRSFAFWLMLSGIAAIIAPPLAGFAVPNASGVHRIELQIDLRDIMFLIAGLVMFLVARMLDEAARIKAELEEIV